MRKVKKVEFGDNSSCGYDSSSASIGIKTKTFESNYSLCGSQKSLISSESSSKTHSGNTRRDTNNSNDDLIFRRNSGSCIDIENPMHVPCSGFHNTDSESSRQDSIPTKDENQSLNNSTSDYSQKMFSDKKINMEREDNEFFLSNDTETCNHSLTTISNSKAPSLMSLNLKNSNSVKETKVHKSSLGFSQRKPCDKLQRIHSNGLLSKSSIKEISKNVEDSTSEENLYRSEIFGVWNWETNQYLKGTKQSTPISSHCRSSLPRESSLRSSRKAKNLKLPHIENENHFEDSFSNTPSFLSYENVSVPERENAIDFDSIIAEYESIDEHDYLKKPELGEIKNDMKILTTVNSSTTRLPTKVSDIEFLGKNLGKHISTPAFTVASVKISPLSDSSEIPDETSKEPSFWGTSELSRSETEKPVRKKSLRQFKKMNQTMAKKKSPCSFLQKSSDKCTSKINVMDKITTKRNSSEFFDDEHHSLEIHSLQENQILSADLPSVTDSSGSGSLTCNSETHIYRVDLKNQQNHSDLVEERPKYVDLPTKRDSHKKSLDTQRSSLKEKNHNYSTLQMNVPYRPRNKKFSKIHLHNPHVERNKNISLLNNDFPKEGNGKKISTVQLYIRTSLLTSLARKYGENVGILRRSLRTAYAEERKNLGGRSLYFSNWRKYRKKPVTAFQVERSKRPSSLGEIRRHIYFLTKGFLSYSLSEMKMNMKEKKRKTIKEYDVKQKFVFHLCHGGYNTFQKLYRQNITHFPERIAKGRMYDTVEQRQHFKAVLSLKVLYTLKSFRKYYKRLRKRRLIQPILKYLASTLSKTFESKALEFMKARVNRKSALRKLQNVHYMTEKELKEEENKLIGEKIRRYVTYMYKGINKETHERFKKKPKKRKIKPSPFDVLEVLRIIFNEITEEMVEKMYKRKVLNKTRQEAREITSRLKEIIEEFSKQARKKINKGGNKYIKESIGRNMKDGQTRKLNDEIKFNKAGIERQVGEEMKNSKCTLQKDGQVYNKRNKKTSLDKDNNYVGTVPKYDQKISEFPELTVFLNEIKALIKKEKHKKTGRFSREIKSAYKTSKHERTDKCSRSTRKALTYSYQDLDYIPHSIKLSRDLARRPVKAIQHSEWSFEEDSDKLLDKANWEILVNRKVDNVRIGNIYSSMNRFEYPYRSHYVFNANGKVARTSSVLRNTICCVIIFTKYSLWDSPVIKKFDLLFSKHKDNMGGKCGVLTLSIDNDEVEWVLSMLYRPGENLWWYINFSSSLKWYFLMKYKPRELPAIFAIDKYGFRTSIDVIHDLETYGHSALHRWVRSYNMLLPVPILGNFHNVERKVIAKHAVDLEDLRYDQRPKHEEWENAFDYPKKLGPKAVRL